MVVYYGSESGVQFEDCKVRWLEGIAIGYAIVVWHGGIMFSVHGVLAWKPPLRSFQASARKGGAFTPPPPREGFTDTFRHAIAKAARGS